MNYFVNKMYVTIILNNKTSTVFKSENPAEYNSLIEILMSNATDKISHVNEILNKISKFHEYVEMLINQTHVVVKNNDIYIANKKLSPAFATHIRRQMEQGEQITPFVNFINKLMKNPNKDIIDQISEFVQASLDDNGFTISNDGYLYAYKKVRNDYLDIYSGTYLNIPGSIHSMDRKDVECNRNVTCSSGLHFCAWSYLDKFNNNNTNTRIIMVKIHPGDIVSIPNDYNNAKGRCCKYEVVGEFNYSEPLKKTVLYKKELKSNTIVHNNIVLLQDKINAYYDAYNKNVVNDTYILSTLASMFTAKEFNEIYSDFIFEHTCVRPELKLPKISKEKYINKMLKQDTDSKYYYIRDFHNFLLKRGERLPSANVLHKINLGESYKHLSTILSELTLNELVVVYNICAEYYNKITNTSYVKYVNNPKCPKNDFIMKLLDMCEGAKNAYTTLTHLKNN